MNKFSKSFFGFVGILLAISMFLGTPAAHATAGAWQLANGARSYLLAGTIKSGDTFKTMLFTNASNITVASDACTGTNISNEVGTSNTGYTTGGITTGVTLAGTTSVTWAFTSNPVWTAGTSNLTAKWGASCDTTSNHLLALFTLDSAGGDITATSGNTLTISSNGSPGPVFTFA